MLRNNRASKFSFLLSILRLVILIIFIDISWITLSRAQDKCNTALTDARIMYEGGHFDQAINRLTQCLPDGIPKDQHIEAYRIISLSYFREDYQDSAKQAIGKIFNLDRNFKPNADDPKSYKEILEQVRKNLPVPFKEKLFSGKRKWFWISGGVIVIVAVVKDLVSQPTTKEGPLPVPPDLPGDP